MSDFNEFLKAISDGKKHHEENDIGAKAIARIKNNISEDFSKAFGQLKPIQEQIESLPENTKGLAEAKQIIQEINEVADSQPEKPQGTERYLADASFQNPNPEVVEPDTKAIQQKIKFLEQWLGKISAHGPGSGETRLRYLDDIDRSTIADNRYLKYDDTAGKFIFDAIAAGDVGTLNYLQLNTSGPGIDTQPGMLSWNASEDCLDVTQNDGSILQVGLENYIRVANDSGSTLANGTCVRFSGVSNDVATAVPLIGDGSVEPLYLIGIITGDILDGEVGRATVLGNVRGIDTRGTNEGESWAVGDILWVSPDTAGKLTKVKPTMPDIAVSVAAITKVGETDGELLVRPTIWPRLFYGTFSSTQEQTAAQNNTAYEITFNTTNIASGFSIEDNTEITAAYSGLYNFNANVQMTSTNASAKDIYFWVAKNGTNIANSTRIISLAQNSQSLVFNCLWEISLTADDYVEVRWATSDTAMKLSSPAATAFAPATPSILLTVTQSAL